MARLIWLGVVLTLATSVQASSVNGTLAAPPRSAFLTRPTIAAATLAPAGDQVSWIALEGPRRSLWTRALDGSAPRRLLAHTPARELAYTRDGRWLLLAADDQLHALAMAGQRGSGLLARLDRDSQWRVDPTAAAGITLLGPAAAGHGWQLQRIAVGGASQLLHADERRISGYALAGDGSLAWLQRVEGLTLVLYHQPSGRAALHCGAPQRCTPVAVAGAELLLLSNGLNDDPRGLARLLRIDAAGNAALVARDPLGEADLDFLVSDPTGRPRLAGYQSTQPQLAPVQPDDAVHVGRLQAVFPDAILRPQIGDGRWLIEVQHADAALPQWHLYDPGSLTTELLPLEAASDPLPAASPTQRYSWQASDGLRLHGFLTLPPGQPSRLPLVVLAHGGPWNHWQPRYNTLAQFIASRGAIVFQPNHRGSTGHGQAYLLAAQGDYGNGRVQADIDEGVRALLAAGIGDRERVAIVGASFGGYAALLGATFRPDLYRMAVAYVPPTDFAWTLQWILRNAESLELERLIPLADWLRLLQLDVSDPARMATLRAQSPLANIDRLQRPVLIVAGGADQRVGIAGIIEYAARARLLGKPVQLLIDHQAGHQQRHDLAREANLYLLESMLHQHLDLPAPAPADPLLVEYLELTMH